MLRVVGPRDVLDQRVAVRVRFADRDAVRRRGVGGVGLREVQEVCERDVVGVGVGGGGVGVGLRVVAGVV